MIFPLPDDREQIVFLTRANVDFFHEQILEVGQVRGHRSIADLESAIGRAKTAAHYEEDADFARLAAYYWHGISANHGYIDGNKRTGFISMTNFLNMNGFEFSYDPDMMGPTIEGLFVRKEFNLDRLERIVRLHTRAFV